jgi:hypothetical protein
VSKSDDVSSPGDVQRSWASCGLFVMTMVTFVLALLVLLKWLEVPR